MLIYVKIFFKFQFIGNQVLRKRNHTTDTLAPCEEHNYNRPIPTLE